MKSVLRKLEAVTESEAVAKRAALLAVRDAFVYRREAPPGKPTSTGGAGVSAIDFLLGEMCDAARSQMSNRTLVDAPLAGGSYARCML